MQSGQPPAEALILASASARRRAYLADLGMSFEVFPADVDETPLAGEAAEAMARRLAHAKAAAAARARPRRWVLAADTVVVADAEILGKPVDRADARRMLQLLSGRAHRVITAVVLLTPGGAAELDDAAVTGVVFHPLDAAGIDAYLDTGEADDKAGAYGIQGAAGAFVAGVEGSYSNVVGLPLELVVPALRRAGLLPPD